MKILFFVLISTAMNAQIKIGNITLPDSIAKEYLLDCYSHPDIVQLRHTMDFYDNLPLEKFHNTPYKNTGIQDSMDLMLKTHGSIVYSGYSRTLINGNYEEAKRKSEEQNAYIKTNSIGKIKDAWGWEWYLIPRKPTEIDLIKWLAK